MSTPRTDAEIEAHPWTKSQVSADFARQLEAELAEAKRELELTKQISNGFSSALLTAEAQLAAAKSLLEEHAIEIMQTDGPCRFSLRHQESAYPNAQAAVEAAIQGRVK